MSMTAVRAQGQEPRLPTPSSAPSPSEALIQRARSLSDARNYGESAAAWQAVAAREPSIASLAQREAIRALIAAGDLEAARAGLTSLGNTAPAELLLRAADMCRSRGAFDCAASLYRRARQAAGRTAEADEAALGLAGTLEQDRKPREALVTYRELQLTFGQATSFDAADSAVRRLSSQLDGTKPLTEANFDAIVDRLVSVAAFRRAVDMQAEWLERFPDSARRVSIESAIVQNLYSLRANEEARARATAFLKQHQDSVEAHDVFIVLFRLDVREGRTADVEVRGRAIMNGEVQGADVGRPSGGRAVAGGVPRQRGSAREGARRSTTSCTK